MDAARWERLQALFDAALDLPASEQVIFLQQACGEDVALFDDAIAMLAAASCGDSLLNMDIRQIASEIVVPINGLLSAVEIGPYRLKELLGEGGMGVVWLAERIDAGNEVAIKFLLHAQLSPARRERFASEVRTLARLNHPFIARMYDAGSLPDGTPWLVMEYVKGSSLTSYCRKPGRSLDQILQLFHGICEAVQHAHSQLVVHRDLKPSNILIREDGTPKLLDFGIARELQQLGDSAFLEPTAPGLRFMSPGYAAPEWKNDGIVAASNDVYSLGVILYEMLTGTTLSVENNNSQQKSPQRPSSAFRRTALKGKVGFGLRRSVGKDVCDDLDVLALKAMHHDPGQRYPSVEALIRDLDHFADGEPIEARPEKTLYVFNKFIHRNRVAVLAALFTFALILFLSMFFTWRLVQARNAALVQAARTQRIQRFMLNLFEGDDKEAGPGQDLRVVTLLDRGVPAAQSLSSEPQVQAELYQTLGLMYMQLGKLEQANSMIQSAMKLRSTDSAADKTALVETMIAQGLLRSEQGKSDDAEHLIQGAITLLGTSSAQDTALRARALTALGKVLTGQGKYASAINALDQAVALESPQDSTSGLSDTLSQLADAHLYLGHYTLSASLDDRTLTYDRSIYSGNHPRIAEDLHNLSQAEELWGKYAEAEKHERQALQINEAWYGRDNPKTAVTEVALASTLIYRNDYVDAEDLLRKALQTQENVYGSMSPHVAYVLNSLAGIENHKKHFTIAEDDFRRMASIYRNAYGDADYRVAIALSNLSGVYVNENRLLEAEHLYEDVIQRLSKALPADNINTAIAEVKLGRVLMAEHRYNEAEPHTEAGYQILLKQQAPSSGFVKGARHDLATIYSVLGQSQKAQAFQQ